MTRILFVVATPQEAADIPAGPEAAADTDLLITGIGLLNASIALTRRLAERPGAYAHIINVGTAGAVVDTHAPVHGFHEVTSAFQHDLSDELIGAIVGRPWPNLLEIPAVTDLPAARLATGDSFISSAAERERIAGRGAQLVDMEGYAVARVAAEYGVPVTLIKQVSDSADDDAAGQWVESAIAGSASLAETLAGVAAQISGRGESVPPVRWPA
ncbi:nucleosidase [Corynebacterium guangdongense]|uniref:Adenosylhomocysteine nucleosidase n=1 Tax=Corynebacterium guangdongense TaxID=1783348 RepID=A0ABU1ZZN9_9CORY|nr:nucleosidase [Corynebacterium guangdongense]MDR7330390.1 adenosylhomocysteine nucleosidase [Corynebacterium guangdongense]WJZ18948.1 Aminodeoxyfutalosine nucleosidase [Corynebacterium guangdongense]